MCWQYFWKDPQETDNSCYFWGGENSAEVQKVTFKLYVQNWLFWCKVIWILTHVGAIFISGFCVNSE